MGQTPKTPRADLFGKDLGADNACTRNYSAGEVSGFVGKKRRAPRGGLLGGRYVRHPTIDRFWARVYKKPHGCWLFSGAKWCRGGHIYFSRDDGTRVSAHRYSYELHHGPIEPSAVVRHSCDTPTCVNPAHLIVGSQRNNVEDAIQRDRRNAFGRQRLTLAQALDIRARFALGQSQKTIARHYGVSKGCVHAVVHRLTWAHAERLQADRSPAEGAL
jgi:hypothetical protein